MNTVQNESHSNAEVPPLEIYICFTYALGVFLDKHGHVICPFKGFQGHRFYLMDSIQRTLLDKLPNKEKSKPPPQFRMPNKPRGQFWDFRGHLEVI